jgi:hypothetical protein
MVTCTNDLQSDKKCVVKIIKKLNRRIEYGSIQADNHSTWVYCSCLDAAAVPHCRELLKSRRMNAPSAHGDRSSSCSVICMPQNRARSTVNCVFAHPYHFECMSSRHATNDILVTIIQYSLPDKANSRILRFGIAWNPSHSLLCTARLRASGNNEMIGWQRMVMINPRVEPVDWRYYGKRM